MNTLTTIPRESIEVLDIACDDSGRMLLLDGEGNPGAATWLTFRRSDIGCARNSRGELFRPNITIEDFHHAD